MGSAPVYLLSVSPITHSTSLQTAVIYPPNHTTANIHSHTHYMRVTKMCPVKLNEVTLLGEKIHRTFHMKTSSQVIMQKCCVGLTTFLFTKTLKTFSDTVPCIFSQ